MPSPIVEARNLTQRYGDLVAVNDISFSIETGEVFGLLGPNGAGKSTAISVMTCLFPPSSGQVSVGGHDVVREADQVKRMIGVVPQDLALYPTLSARDNLIFFGEMYGLGGATLKQRVDDALAYVALSDRARSPVQTLSGGMKRRVNLAAGLINNPTMLFLDEPTVGVDPQSRNHIFETVERLNRERGMTVLYTTHYMEEAERLCHRIAIVDHGRIIALDTPRNLIDMLGGGIIHIGVARADEALAAAAGQLPAVKAAGFLPLAPVDDGAPSRRVLKVEAHNASDALIQIIQLFSERRANMLSIETLEPNLESVFLHLTGKSLRD